MKKLIPAICMLLVSVMLLGTSTYAWFSMNTTATASGMKIKAIAGGSLVVGKVVNGGDTTTGFPTKNSANIEAKYTITTATGLQDCTHDDSVDGTKLKTLDAASRKAVNVDTGKTGENPTYTNIKTTDTGYYVDYTMYIASSTDTDINASELNVSFTIPDAGTGNALNDGVAVDWYVADTYTVTSHITDSTAKNIIKSATKIPAAAATTGTAEKSLKITMRVYIDGNVDSAIQNENFNANDIAFSVTLTAVPAST